MGIRSKLFFCLTVLLFFGFKASAQVVPKVETEEEPRGLIQKAIEDAQTRAPFRAGAFWVQPRLNLFGAYDSNSFLLSTDVEDDFTFQATPGIIAILPFRERAILEIQDDVNFIYYRDIEDLRGVFNRVGAKFTIGGNRVLFTFEDTFTIKRASPSQELDFPTDQRINDFNSSLTLALGERSEVRTGVSSYSAAITDEIVNPTGIPLSQLFDRRTLQIFGGYSRYVSRYTSFLFETYYEHWDFPEGSLQPNADIYAAEAGFNFQAKGNIVGRATLGFKRSEPNTEDLTTFTGLIGTGSVDVRIGERTILRLQYVREPQPTADIANWLFIESRIAPSLEFFLTRTFSVLGELGYHRNSYPEPGQIVSSTGEIVVGEIDDSAILGTLSIRFRVARIWQFFITGSTFSRDSNQPNSEKKREVLGAGVQIAY